MYKNIDNKFNEIIDAILDPYWETVDHGDWTSMQVPEEDFPKILKQINETYPDFTWEDLDDYLYLL